MAGNYALFRSQMKPFKMSNARGSTINHAFASALATADAFDEHKLDQALALLGQSSTEPLRCVYCDADAQTADHLHGLVKDSKYTGHGHVIGNLVPCCRTCNERKGKKSWREWAKAKGTPDDQVAKIAAYELLAPPVVADEDLRQLYPDLMEAYDRLRVHTRDLMKTADHLASEIRRLEGERLHRRMDGGDEGSQTGDLRPRE